MEKLVQCCLISCNDILEVKAIAESFEEFAILVPQAKLNVQTTGFAAQLLKIKDKYKCLVMLIER